MHDIQCTLKVLGWYELQAICLLWLEQCQLSVQNEHNSTLSVHQQMYHGQGCTIFLMPNPPPLPNLSHLTPGTFETLLDPRHYGPI